MKLLKGRLSAKPLGLTLKLIQCKNICIVSMNGRTGLNIK